MTKEEYINKLQERINELEKYLTILEENDYVEKGIVLGKINGLLQAKVLAYDIRYIQWEESILQLLRLTTLTTI